MHAIPLAIQPAIQLACMTPVIVRACTALVTQHVIVPVSAIAPAIRLAIVPV
jgi:hypothetical protein